MQVSTDAHYIIGMEHDYCQDYAIAGTFRDKNFAVVCDGCSSAANSDLGARLLALAFKEAVHTYSFDSENFPLDEIHRSVKSMCMATQAITHIYDEAFFATVVAAVQHGKNLWVWMQGDGVFAIKRRDGKVLIYTCNNSVHNAPAYLAYTWDKQSIESYLKMQEITINTQIVIENSVEVERSILNTFYADPSCATYLIRFDVDEIESVIVLSDGIESFRADTTQDILKMTNIPNLNGSFVLRKLKTMKKAWTKAEMSHYDDIGMAAMVFTHEDSENG